jgi:hypothetical protein
MTNPYPMMKGAGLFILLVGVGITVGGLLGGKHIIRMLIAGGVLATLSQIVRVQGVTDFPGTPSRSQLSLLVGGILLEVLLIALVVYMIRERSRKFWLWILFVVGLHFIILSFAQGPPLLWLGVVSMANALIGLGLTNTSYLRFWVIDGLLKIAVGAWMLYSG